MAQSPIFSIGCRHSRPSAVRASMCTRSGSLSKPATDLGGQREREKEDSQLAERLQSDSDGEGKQNQFKPTLGQLVCRSPPFNVSAPLGFYTDHTQGPYTNLPRHRRVTLPVPCLQDQDYYDCSCGGKESCSQVPVKSEFCFNAKGKTRAQQPHAFRKQIKRRFYLAN